MKTYFITGTYQGIGNELANYILENVIDSVIIGIDKNLQTQSIIALNNPLRFFPVQGDIADPNSWSAQIDPNLLKNLYSVCLVAGIQQADFTETLSNSERIFNTNLFSAMRIIDELRPYLKNSPHTIKHIAAVSSICSLRSIPKYSAYCASKAALESLIRTWALEFARYGVRANSIAPGWVETPMLDELLSTWANSKKVTKEVLIKGGEKLSPLDRISSPSEVAQLIAWVIDEKQTSITSQNIRCDNGIS